jgi:hypothetical protein
MALLALIKIVQPLHLSKKQIDWVEKSSADDRDLQLLKVRLAAHTKEYNKAATAVSALYNGKFKNTQCFLNLEFNMEITRLMQQLRVENLT